MLVRALPLSSISDDSVRKLYNELRASMTSNGMVPVEFVKDAEWNSVRIMGTYRPISLIQLLMDARKETTSTHVSEIEKCLTINKCLMFNVSLPQKRACKIVLYMIS